MQKPSQSAEQLPTAPIGDATDLLPDAIAATDNDSGTGSAAKLPQTLHGFNWAAFVMNWAWAIGMRFWWGVLYLPMSFILGMLSPLGSLASLGIALAFGLKGNQWAWQSRKWESVEQFRKTQRVWVVWGIALVVLSIPILFVLFLIGYGARSGRGPLP
jgi:hypothetical protein